MNVNGLPKQLTIGRRGENLVKSYKFDFAPWVELYGAGDLSLLIRRHGESVVYPATMQIDGNIATWTVTNTETSIVGDGEINLVYKVDEAIKKSEFIRTIVQDALTGTTEQAPAPYQSYVEQILDAASAVSADARAASDSAEAAAQSAADAADAVRRTILFNEQSGNVEISFAEG